MENSLQKTEKKKNVNQLIIKLIANQNEEINTNNMKQTFTLLLLLSVYSAWSQQEIKSLFNGNDLAGWTIHGTEKWYVENSELVCESGPDKQYGYLSTDKLYTNFELTVQFKLEANGNSGVFIRSGIEGTKISGWQVEVAPLGQHTGGIYESYGRGWLIQPKPDDEKMLKPDDWNTMRILVLNDEVTSWLNEVQMVYLKDEKIGLGKGFIALQIHDGGGIKVRWKKILIKEL